MHNVAAIALLGERASSPFVAREEAGREKRKERQQLLHTDPDTRTRTQRESDGQEGTKRDVVG